MPTQKQRRDAARRHLERQLQRRADKEAARKRFALIASVVGTLLVVGIIVVALVMANSDSGSPKAQAAPSSPAPATSSAPVTSACPTGNAPVRVAKGAGPLTRFDGVTVRNATDMAHNPAVGSSATKAPTTLLYKDLVVGKGKAATPSSSVKVQYTGVLYCDGTQFDGPSTHGNTPIGFSLTGVVPGFTQGIGGGKSIPPMKVGGRRIIIMPASLGYGAQANGSIPANAPLVFLVDLKSVS